MFVDLSVRDFLQQLSSQSPTPGGGSVAAIAGALSAGLLSMVCRLTAGKKGYEAVEEDMKQVLVRSEEIREKLTLLIDEDSRAFDQVIAGFSMPRETETEKTARSIALQAAYKRAADVPYQIAEYCLEVLILAEAIVDKGNKNLISDVGVAAKIALAALESAFMNIDINLPAIKDERYVKHMQNIMSSMKSRAESSAQKTYNGYCSRMGF